MLFKLIDKLASFQHYINNVLFDCLHKFCQTYLNDILIYSKILKEHRTHVKEVLNKLREVNLQINIDKCKFKIQKISFLELLIFINDLRMNSWKVDVIRSWKVLRSLTHVQIFIDFCNFYRWFIKNFSKIIWLMIKLIWKDHLFEWTEICQMIFEELKQQMMTVFILKHFDSIRKVILKMNFLNYVNDEVLSQYDDENILHSVIFYSKNMIFAEKMMFQTHFLSSSEIFMLNTIDFKYSLSIKDDVLLIHHEIKRVIYKATSDKTLKHMRYINRIMCKLINDASEQICFLFERCLQKKIQSTQFKSAVTIVMQKSDKKDYFNAKIYKSIVLFDTLSKILKFVVFEHLQNVVKACNLILNTQMRVCKHRLINITLQLIIKKIHTVWSDTRRRVISLLSLNEKNAFNNVMHSKLLHDMKKRKVFRLLFKFVKNFLKDQCIMITINDYMMTKCSLNINISQDSSLSLILYLFYNANLLKVCDDIKLRTNFTDFLNDINILTYEEFMKCNCRVFSKIYNKCKQWSKMHDIKFLMTKHELIHFTRIFK